MTRPAKPRRKAKRITFHSDIPSPRHFVKHRGGYEMHSGKRSDCETCRRRVMEVKP